MKLILILLILCVLGGPIVAQNWQLVLAKHSSSSNEDKKTDSNNQPTTNEQTKNSDIIPIEKPTAIVATAQPKCETNDKSCDAIQIPQCEPNDTACNIKQGIAENIQQSIPQVTPSPKSTDTTQQHQIALDNQAAIDSPNQQSTSGSSNSGSGSSSTSNQNEGEENQNKNLGVESHFVVMSQDKEVGLYRIVSDEVDLDTTILPQTIRLIKSFDNMEEAISSILEYDSRN